MTENIGRRLVEVLCVVCFVEVDMILDTELLDKVCGKEVQKDESIHNTCKLVYLRR